MPAWLAPAIIGGSSFLGNMFGNASNARQNRENREWQEKMWRMNNEYNTPTNQMARFKEAGLNPHLIYGQAGYNASTPSLPQQFQEFNPNTFSDAAMAYVSVRKQQTEIDNLEKAREVMEADEMLKKAQSVKNLSDSAKTDQDKQQAKDLFSTTVAQAELNVKNTEIMSRKLEAEIDSIGWKNRLDRAQIDSLKQGVEESKQRIISARFDNNYKAVQTELGRLDIELKKLGVMPSDPAYMRIITRVLSESGIDVMNNSKDNFLQDFQNNFNNAGKKTGQFFKDLYNWNWGDGKNPFK